MTSTQLAGDVTDRPLRVLHSYPQRLGAGRICTTAWYEIQSVANAGHTLNVLAGDCVKALQPSIHLSTTLRWGAIRLPYRPFGPHFVCALHDLLVARKLERLRNTIDIIHTWPLASRRTLKEASRLGIPTALERCNAHTRFAYEAVAAESKRIGVTLPHNHEHAWNSRTLAIEEREYRLATALLCPSDFTLRTFLDKGLPANKLVRFIYGVDTDLFFPSPTPHPMNRPLTMLFVGVAAVRKGLHIALDAWLQSPASKAGKFIIVGDFVPSYRERLAPLLSHPSVNILGHRNDVPDLMRTADVFVMPSIEEGFGLVCTEALASGCVPLVSNACTELCKHNHNALVHEVGATDTLKEHITRLHHDRALLHRLREQGLRDRGSITWAAAGESLVAAYRAIIAKSRHATRTTPNIAH